jgi:hypothetical protein
MTRSFFVVPPILNPDIVVPNDTISALSVGLDFAVFNPYIPPIFLRLIESTGGLFTTPEDYSKFLHDMFLSNKSSLITRGTRRRWLRSFFTNQDFVTEVGMPWEIYLQTLPSGRNTKVWGKSGGIFEFHSYISVNTELGFSVPLFETPSDWKVVAFQTGSSDATMDITVAAHKLFAPIFENIVLDHWNSSYGGKYVSNNTLVEIDVNFKGGSIELAQLQGKGVDALGVLGSTGRGITNRTDVLSYLWPGVHKNTFR